jgi:hypothetical protein
MRHTLSTLTVLFILLTSSMSWGSVDGNGVICRDKTEKKSNRDYPKFLIFENGMVHLNGITNRNDIVITTKGKILPYSTSPSTISWYIPMVAYEDEYLSYTLNRKDLSLKTVWRGNEGIDVCEVYPTKILMEKISEMLIDYQSEYDKKKKDNKI